MELVQGVVAASRSLIAAANVGSTPPGATRFSFLTNGRSTCNRAAAPAHIPQPPDPDSLDPTPRLRKDPPLPPSPSRSAPKAKTEGQARADTQRRSPPPNPNRSHQTDGRGQVDPGEVRRIVHEVLAEKPPAPRKVDVALQVDLPSLPSAEEQESFSLSGLTERLFPVLLPLRACCSASVAKRKADVVSPDQVGARRVVSHAEQKERKAATNLGRPVCGCAAGTCAIGLCSAGALAVGAGLASAVPCACASSSCAAGACVASACASRLGANARWIEQTTREAPTGRTMDLQPLVIAPEGFITPPGHFTSSDPDALVCEPDVWRPLRRPRAEVLRPDLGSPPPRQVAPTSSPVHRVTCAPPPPAATSSPVHKVACTPPPPASSPVACTTSPRLYGRKVSEYKMSRI